MSAHIAPSPVGSGPPVRPVHVPGGRDERIDFMRGLAMIAVIVNHVAIPSFYNVLSVEGLGLVSGAEGFVLISGVMVGLIYGRRMLRHGWPRSAKELWARVGRIYGVALATALVVYLLKLVDIIDVSPLTTYWDPKTRRLFSLYGENPGIGDFCRGMVTLAYGPGQINILGLYVALLAIAPLALWAMRSRWVFLVVGLSGIVYFLQYVHPIRVLPAQSENSFTVLSWQILFLAGMLAGFYRERIKAIYRGRYGALCCWTIGALTVVFWLLALNHPGHDVPGRIRLTWLSESTFYWIYERFFQRTVLGPGRILNVLVLAATMYLFLTRFWSPIRRAASWLLIPIGRATLAVFVVHLVFVVAVHHIELLQQGKLWINTLAHTLIILMIGLLVRSQALRWIR